MKQWFEERLHLSQTLAAMFDHPVPKRSSFLDYLGFATLFSLINQAVTGILLATVYTPSAEGAYASIKVIQATPVGNFVRSLHSWGANFMVVLIVLHLLRVFYEGAYKRPRELTWIMGVILLIGTLGLAFTGYLLPWDQEGYWATVVGSAMAGYVPFIGNLLVEFLRNGAQVTGTTLTLFYSVHMLMLPALILLAFAPHFFFVLRQGMVCTDELGEAKKQGEDITKDSLPFWPNVAFRMILVVIFVGAAMWILAAVYPKGLGAPADALNKAHYIPEPAWYFFGIYQMLKYFPGYLDVLAMVGLPLIFFAVLFALPWLDRNPSRKPRKRPIALSVAGVLVAGLVFLTYQGMASVPKALADNGVISHPSYKKDIEPVFQNQCIICHGSTNNYALDNYANVMKIDVIPGNADGSKLIQKLEGTVKPQMPIGKDPLSPDQIKTIRNWIQDGAKNN